MISAAGNRTMDWANMDLFDITLTRLTKETAAMSLTFARLAQRNSDRLFLRPSSVYQLADVGANCLLRFAFFERHDLPRRISDVDRLPRAGDNDQTSGKHLACFDHANSRWSGA